MLHSEKTNLLIELDTIEIEDIEVFLQEGSRGMPEFAASCSTICGNASLYFCCIPSCACRVADDDEEEMEKVLSD